MQILELFQILYYYNLYLFYYLNRLHITENQNAYSENYRSLDRLGKAIKRYFTDPSLACSCLDLTQDKLLDDPKTFGFMFESLVERDLRIYMSYLGGKLYHFRDNVTGLEIYSILELEYAAVEIKLGCNKEVIDDSKKSLLNFYNNMKKKPKFMCIITKLQCISHFLELQSKPTH